MWAIISRPSRSRNGVQEMRNQNKVLLLTATMYGGLVEKKSRTIFPVVNAGDGDVSPCISRFALCFCCVPVTLPLVLCHWWSWQWSPFPSSSSNSLITESLITPYASTSRLRHGAITTIPHYPVSSSRLTSHLPRLPWLRPPSPPP